MTDSFNALGTTVEGSIIASADTARTLWDIIKDTISKFENNFSRFNPDSELSKVNNANGQPVIISPEFAYLLNAGRHAYNLSHGLVDPAVGQAVINVGYDDSFENLRDDSPATQYTTQPKFTGFGKILFDPVRRLVQLPPGVKLDVGGIGKGYLLDFMVSKIKTKTPDFWLSLGGDMIISGYDENHRRWTVNVQDPNKLTNDIAVVTLPAGLWAIATSSVMKRRGQRGGQDWHHLIDPRTQMSSDTNILSATVITPTALGAEVEAKMNILNDLNDEPGDLPGSPYEYTMIVTRAGHVKMTPAMKPLVKFL